MLKIKFNIKEFTVIFLRRFEGKNECKRISFSLYQLQRPPLLFFSFFSVQPPFSASAPLFFCSLCSAPPSFFSVQHLLFQFSFSPTFLKSSPKLVAAQKAHSISPIRACLSVKMKSNRLPQNQKGPAFHANSQAKEKIFLQPPFIQNPIFSLVASSLLFE